MSSSGGVRATATGATGTGATGTGGRDADATGSLLAPAAANATPSTAGSGGRWAGGAKKGQNCIEIQRRKHH